MFVLSSRVIIFKNIHHESWFTFNVHPFSSSISEISPHLQNIYVYGCIKSFIYVEILMQQYPSNDEYIIFVANIIC